MSETTQETKTVFRPASVHLQRTADGVAEALARMGNGDRAALRRLRPTGLNVPAFWKLTTSALQGALDGDDKPWRATQERQWALILSVAAGSTHSPAMRLGTALARAGVSEARLTRLLRARGEQLPDAARVIAHQIVSAAVPFDFADLAWLVLSEGRHDEERARQQIARDYYRASGAEA